MLAKKYVWQAEAYDLLTYKEKNERRKGEGKWIFYSGGGTCFAHGFMDFFVFDLSNAFSV
jgi:hypothetical protein